MNSLSGQIAVPYSWSAGKYASIFYNNLTNKKEIWGTRCPQCNKVFVPPKSTCTFCFVKVEDWIQLSRLGSLTSFTVVRYTEDEIQPVKAPFALGLIKLDCADTNLLHLIGEVEFKDIYNGMRVEAIFSEEPQGNLLDIKYFRPVPAQ